MFNKLPGFLAKFVSIEGGTNRGKAAVEVIKNNGGIVSASIKSQNIINFPQKDNRQALIAITQKLTDLGASDNSEESYNFRVEAKKGRITRMFITNEFIVEINKGQIDD